MAIRARKFFLSRIFLAFFISTIIFVCIFLFSYLVAYSNLVSAENNGKIIESRLNELKSFAGNNSQCDSDSFLKLSISLEEEGSRVSFLEKKLGKENKRVYGQKVFYSDLEIAHFLLAKKLNENCNTSFVPILFFYSNNESLQESSDIMGYILGQFKEENPSTVMVYSFDATINSTSISELIKSYNISSVPVIVDPSGKKLFIDNIDSLSYLLK